MPDRIVTVQVTIKDHAEPTWLLREILQLYGVRSVVEMEYGFDSAQHAMCYQPDESTRITRPGGQR